MNNTSIKELNKKLAVDQYCTTIIVAAVAITTVANFISFFLTKDVAELKYGFFSLFATIISGILALVFQDIRKLQTPFAKPIIHKLRAMAIVISIAAVVPELLSRCVEMMMGQTSKMTFNLSLGNETTFILLIGMIVGIVSEIFVYGAKLQEDVDSIA